MERCGKGARLVLTIIFWSIDVLETNKEDDKSLGRVLQIDDSTYNDLDELLVSHIEAILGRIHALMSSPKYRENEYELSKSRLSSHNCVLMCWWHHPA